MTLKAKTYEEAIADVAAQLLTEGDGRATYNAMYLEMEDQYAPQINDKFREGRRQQVIASFKAHGRLLRESADNAFETPDQPTQGALPGMAPPMAIAIEIKGVAGLVGYLHATWADLVVALESREINIRRAVLRKADFEAKKDFLRPYMEEWPEREVHEALAIIRGGLGYD